MPTIYGAGPWRFADDQIQIPILTESGFEWHKCDLNPYFFVDSDSIHPPSFSNRKGVLSISKTGLWSIRKKQVYKVEVEKPSLVPRLRSAFPSYAVHEADIPFIRRLGADRYFQFASDPIKHIAYYDIEVISDTSILPTPESGRIISIAIVHPDGRSEWLYNPTDDRHLIEQFLNYLRQHRIYILAGWNNYAFDDKFIEHRVRQLHDYLDFWHSIQKIDLMLEYKSAIRGASYSLNAVAKAEGIGEKLSRPPDISSMPKSELRDYNIRDADLVRLIDQKYAFTHLRYELQSLTGVLINDASPSRWHDNLIIRRARELMHVLPTVQPRKDRPELKGAFVLEPKPGIHENVAVFDINSLYPNIVIHEQIDHPHFRGQLIPVITKQLLESRAKYKAEYKSTNSPSAYIKQYAYKILANSLYGVLTMPWFRLYHPEIGNSITGKGRSIIQSLISYVRSLGLEVLYADTDSVFVYPISNFKHADWLMQKINSYLYPYSVKFEKLYIRILFIGDEKGGRKKRYAGLTTDGQIDVKGLELIRGDWSELAKEVQSRVIEMVLHNRPQSEIESYLSEIKSKLYAGQLDDKLILAKHITKRLSEYKANQPHVRAARILTERYNVDERAIAVIEYVMATTPESVFPVAAGWDKAKQVIDRKWYWTHQVKPVADRILKAIRPRSGHKQITLL